MYTCPDRTNLNQTLTLLCSLTLSPSSCQHIQSGSTVQQSLQCPGSPPVCRLSPWNQDHLPEWYIHSIRLQVTVVCSTVLPPSSLFSPSLPHPPSLPSLLFPLSPCLSPSLHLAHIPLFLYPFLHTVSKSRPFEYLRLTSLGVVGALVKVHPV